MTQKMMKTLAFRSVSVGGQRFLVLLHTVAEPNADEWRAYLREVATVLSDAIGVVHSMVVTDGGGPNAAQRKELADVIARSRADLLTHVFTTNPVVRGIVTAFRWITRAGAIAHAPSELAAVCADAQLPVDEILRAWADVQRSLPTVHTLELMDPTRRTRAASR